MQLDFGEIGGVIECDLAEDGNGVRHVLPRVLSLFSTLGTLNASGYLSVEDHASTWASCSDRQLCAARHYVKDRAAALQCS